MSSSKIKQLKKIKSLMQYDKLCIKNTASSMSLIFKCADAAVNKYAPCLKCFVRASYLTYVNTKIYHKYMCPS